ncbi:hypothetical protein KQI84_15870 [bacterium]|nr:hypothetical protein [bacterium]
MTNISWWRDGLMTGFGWWLTCVVISLAALPLVMRFFRGLADRGAGIAMGAGIALTVFVTWALSMRWFLSDPQAFVFRAAMLMAGVVFVGIGGWRVMVEKRARKERDLLGLVRLYWPAGLFVFLGLVHLPHWGVTAWFAVLLIAVSSALAWAGEYGQLKRRLRNIAIPFLAAQLCFLFAFVFFLNVRSYIPYATYDTGMSAAEKFGNFNHLNSIMQSSSMPPSDAWFLGEPTNYYYGGHLTVATLAKMIGMQGRYAFNFGLATVFGLSFAMGFAFVFNLVQLFPRRSRVGPVSLPRGIVWGLLGAFAIAFFGNLDAWQQLATRDPQAVAGAVRERLEVPLKIAVLEDNDLWTEENISKAQAAEEKAKAALEKAKQEKEEEGQESEDKTEEEKPKPVVDVRGEELAVMGGIADAIFADLSQPERDKLRGERDRRLKDILASPGYLRFSPENLAKVDFWRSSRAIKSSPPGQKSSGTITEFPYFTAILGDLHPHHMAIPYSLLILCSVLSLLRRSMRMVRTDRRWFERVWPDLIAMGVTIGMVFPVNIWDAVVMSPLLLIALIIALRKVKCGMGWRWIGFAGMLVVLTLVAAFVYNMQHGVVVMFGKPEFWLGGIVVLWVGSWLSAVLVQRWELRAACAAVAVVLSLGFNFAGGYFASGQDLVVTTTDSAVASKSVVEDLELPSAGLVALRDSIAFLILAAIAAWWALYRPSPLKRWWITVGSAYAVCGFVALFTILPFKLYFHSPLVQEKQLLVSKLPPRLSPTLLQTSGDFWKEFWSRSPVNPFPPELRTDLRDFFVHWGLFLIPILVMWLAFGIKQTRRWTQGRGFAYWMVFVGLFAFTINYMTKWAGPLSISLMATSIILAAARHRKADGAVWVFLSIAFFYQWFVEVLHFDDTYSGYLERYNTPFKIYYPLWAIMAGGMVFAVSRFAEMFRPSEQEQPRGLVQSLTDPVVYAYLVGVFIVVPWMLKLAGLRGLLDPWFALVLAILLILLVVTLVIPFAVGLPILGNVPKTMNTIRTWALMSPAAVLAVALFLVGMLYPYSSTALRTRSLFIEPLPSYYEKKPNTYKVRTLDAIAYMDEMPGMKGDAEAIDWILENMEPQARILEAPGSEAYRANGRFASNTGRPTMVGWTHHEMQWRGWGKPVESKLAWRFAQRFTLAQLKIHEIGTQLFSANEKDQIAKLKLLATAPKKNLAARIDETFPDMSKDRKERLAEALRDPKAGAISSMDLIEKVKADAEEMYNAATLDQVRELFEFYNIDYVIVGSIEKQRYAGPGLEKFKDWEKVFSSVEGEDVPEDQGTVIYRVPDSFKGGEEVER